jgi:alcohol dehydrogenase class IV
VAREAQPEALVSVGGGSTHDTTEGIAALLGEGGDIHNYEIHTTARQPRHRR